jgi:hypothetical protein
MQSPIIIGPPDLLEDDRVEEKDPNYNFLGLDLTKEHGKAGR